jgi:tRNA(Arg) A34 adenosine deaminase TadA
MTTDSHDHFVGLALGEAQASYDAGNIAVGCVIVRDGAVIGRGQNRVGVSGDPTDHAEVDAIRDACRATGASDLAGATLYTTCEPCPMCLGAMHYAGIGTLVLGARHRKLGMRNLGDYSVERLLELMKSGMKLVTGVREPDCETMRRKSL